MRYGTLFLIMLGCFLAYLWSIQPVFNPRPDTDPVPVITIPPVPAPSAPTPVPIVHYVRTPQGQLLPLTNAPTSEDAQQFEKENAQPPEPERSGNIPHHSTDDLLNDVNKHSL